MRLGGEVDDHVDLVALEDPGDELLVADVANDHLDAVDHLLEALEGGRVGHEVERDDVVVGVGGHPVADEVGADEPGRSGD